MKTEEWVDNQINEYTQQLKALVERRNHLNAAIVQNQSAIDATSGALQILKIQKKELSTKKEGKK